MSVQLAFYGQEGAWTLDEAYDRFLERQAAHRKSGELYEVVLADGLYGTFGTTMRMVVDPRAVAWFRDLDGLKRVPR